MIDGLVYGNEAATGLIKGTSYYHGALRVVISYPDGWDVANTAAEVLGKAPRTSDATISVRLDRGTRHAADADGLCRADSEAGCRGRPGARDQWLQGVLASIAVGDGSAQARTIAVDFQGFKRVSVSWRSRSHE